MDTRVTLSSPRGSQVSTSELRREVEEYFSAGASVAAGDTVVDVGANVGAFSLSVAEKCAGDVTLLCFEPSPETGAALRENFSRIDLLQRTRHTIHAYGLSAADNAGKELSFYNFRRFPTNSTFDLANKRREFEIFFEDRGARARKKIEQFVPVVGRAVEAVVSIVPKGPLAWWITRQVMGITEVKAKIDTLDTVLAREKVARVDLLKIDVEGPELEVLQGLGASSWPLIQQVVMETHNRDGRQAKIEALLRANGLTEIRATLQKTQDNGLESIILWAKRPHH